MTALEAIKTAGKKAKYVVAIETCASYGEIFAATPNQSGSKGVN